MNISRFLLRMGGLLSMLFVIGSAASAEIRYEFDGLSLVSPIKLTPHTDTSGYSEISPKIPLSISYLFGNKLTEIASSDTSLEAIKAVACTLFSHPNVRKSTAFREVQSKNRDSLRKYTFTQEIFGKRIFSEVFIFLDGKKYWIIRLDYREGFGGSAVLRRLKSSLKLDV